METALQSARAALSAAAPSTESLLIGLRVPAASGEEAGRLMAELQAAVQEVPFGVRVARTPPVPGFLISTLNGLAAQARRVGLIYGCHGG